MSSFFVFCVPFVLGVALSLLAAVFIFLNISQVNLFRSIPYLVLLAPAFLTYVVPLLTEALHFLFMFRFIHGFLSCFGFGCFLFFELACLSAAPYFVEQYIAQKVACYHIGRFISLLNYQVRLSIIHVDHAHDTATGAWRDRRKHFGSNMHQSPVRPAQRRTLCLYVLRDK